MDPEDLNVEDEDDYERFARKAELVYTQFREQQALILELMDRGEDAWTQWEFDFLTNLHTELRRQEDTGTMTGLNQSQLTKLYELEH